MNVLTKSAVAVLSASLLLAFAASPAYADNEPVSTSVTAGGLSAAVSGATLSSVAIDGTTAKHSTGLASSTWSITDARGSGAAWGLTVSGTNFTSAAGDTDLTARTLPVGNLVVTAGTVTSGGGADTAPSGGVVTMSGTAQVLVAATGDYKGTFTLTPSFDLLVPANAFRSNFVSGTTGAINPYISTLTFTIA